MDDNNNVNAVVTGPDDIGRKLLENSEKTLKLQRISTLCMVGIFAAVVISVFIIVPKVVGALNDVNTLVDRAEISVDNADATLEDISEMAESLEQAGNKMEQMLVDNEQELVDSMDKISKIDFDGLNEAIKDLQDAIGPMAEFMNRFK